MNSINIKREKFTFLDYFLPLYGLLSYYTLPGVSTVGMLFIYLYAFFILLYKIMNFDIVYFNKYLSILVIYLLVSQPFVFKINGGFNSSRFFNVLSLLAIFIVISVCTDRFHINNFYKVYKFMGLFFSFFILVQAVQVFLFHMSVYQIKILPFGTEEWLFNEGNRPVGFFPEPQAYATYIIPLVYLSIKKNDKLLTLILFISILASSSSLGIVCVVLLVIVYLFQNNSSFSTKLVFFSLALLSLFFMFRFGLLDYAVNKLVTTDYNNNTRLTHGFDIFKKLDISQKFGGIGINNVDYFLKTGKIVLNDLVSLKMMNPAYVTSAAGSLIYFGIFGTAMYAVFLIIMFFKNTDKTFLLLIVLLTFSQTIFFNSPWVFYILIYFSLVGYRTDNFVRLSFS